ncbi:MAG: hypothetical protein WBA13_10105 [Microcoleaceae cyanobacterium]
MNTVTVWQYGSNNPDNATNLDTIRQWWGSLKGQEINWQQRLIPADGDLNRLNWEAQRFDETFVITNSDLRGITLFYFKPSHPQERSLTPSKLELDQLQQQLYIFPQSQPEVVIRVELPKIQYQTVVVNHPEIAVSQKGMILLRDEEQLIEVKIMLTPEEMKQLKEKL